ncbi:CCA tRNA nucleotidyltransferase [Agrococcus casei]|uniref:tRNA nucleotidyltransferase n=1 Tax=Agrococcus casei LMG 22410 TaxID=1255656 RepID=A0A1R4ER05_9MICO|nr:CCA tRNA nucleotidyltransferase [Agrococcus casei]SJM46073.1 tRNA nucleotidyltransferase [Agrococcus casei LMG 22410]
MTVAIAEAQSRLRSLAESEPIATLARAFEARGLELALVGGPVRDAFLGIAVHDLDFTTNALPDTILEIVKPISDAQWDVGREFGTIACRMAGQVLEITTYRSDVYDGDSRKPEVEFGSSLEDDLIRRDFAVNAMALRLPQQQLVDVGGGLEQLVAGVLDTPRSPEQSFRDDPLRMLRAARFTSQLGFTPAARVVPVMAELAGEITRISAERIRDELSKLLLTDDPAPGIRLLTETGLMQHFLPEVPALSLEADEHAHHKDVYEHSITVLQQGIGLWRDRNPEAGPDLVSRLAGLLHDIGKPATKRVEGRTVSFHNHDLVGSRMAKKRLRALRFDNDTIKQVARLIELHLRFFGYSEASWTDAAVRRYVRDAGAELERLHVLTRSDVTTRNRRKADMLDFAYDDLERRIAELAEQEELDSMRPDLDGKQIMQILEIPPGREVGEAYSMLLEARMDHGPLGAERASELLREWWAERG